MAGKPTSLDPQLLLEENRTLRIELETLRAERFAQRERIIARLALSERTLVVKEEELPFFLPFSLRRIRALRTQGKLPFLRDPARKNGILYNLRDVEATLLSGKPADGPLARRVDWEKVRVSA